MRHRALLVSLSAFVALAVGCSKSDFPTTPSPVADTPLTTLTALKVDGSASLPGGAQTPFNMTLIARSLDLTASGTRAQTPGTTEVNGHFVLGTGVTGTLSGGLDGSLANGTLRGTLQSSGDGCTRQYLGPISTAGLAWVANDSSGGCPLPITVQASRTDAPSACTYSISPVGSVPGAGVTTIIEITTGPSCTWVVEAQAPWVRATPSTGVGPGTVTVVVDPSDVPRQGTVLVAGQSLSIDQTPACAVAVAPQSISFPESGDSRTVTVTTQARCDWRAESIPNWLAVSPDSGAGTTTLTLVAQPNSGAERVASLRIGGQPVTITQAARSGGAAPCIDGVTLSGSAFPVTGGTGSIDIAAAAGCAWSAEPEVPWIVIPSRSGSGSGRISFTVQPNGGPARTGIIRVGGRVLTITQPQATVLTGQVTNAINNQPIAGAAVSVGSLSAVTNGSGTYVLTNPPPGVQSVQFSAPTFVSRTETVTIVANSTTTFGTALVPLNADIAIVLTWGMQPPDLDAHLIGPRIEGGTFEVDYETMQPVPYASLDTDDQDGSGPETVTIGRVNGNFVPGSYRFFIDNFSITPGFDVSNAVVVVLQGGFEIVRFPVSGATGQPGFRQWEVFTMTLSATPTGQPQITPVQRFSQPPIELVPSLQRRKR